MDFMRGAGLAAEGRAIIALPSTAARGAASRIVPFLQEGAGVITTRGHVRTVVTEWGVAELFGKTLGERAQALIGIAHPDYRDGAHLRGTRAPPDLTGWCLPAPRYFGAIAAAADKPRLGVPSS